MIEILNVSKKFRIWEDRSRDLKETAINWLRGKKRSYRELWALREINLEIRKGETVAFIGENGSGKSTLLKLLCGIYTPDEGKIVTQGKISTLLELGVGFHPDLTGEENVYLNGAMLGFDRSEMESKFDEIVSFSEIGDFIYSPIRTYSSGMLMRLGFSIATCVNPDILLIDEILAVGDEAFQKKCLERLEKFKAAEKTIIIVSHALGLIKQFCERAILLQEGRMIIDGIPEETIDEYHAILSKKAGRTGSEEREKVAISMDEGDTVTEGETEIEFSPLKYDGEAEIVGGPILGASPEDDLDQVSLNEEGEVELDQERFRIIEVEDAFFFAGKLFFEAFGQPPPEDPTNYAAIYLDPKNPSTFHVGGFVHLGHTNEAGLDEIGFVGGLCVDSRWRGKGVEKMLLLFVENEWVRAKVFFIYTSDSRIASECGYEALPHPYLMVKWVKPLSPEEKERLVNLVMAIGPF